MAQSTSPFIAIAGLIGAGKTTLAEALASELAVDVFHEPVDDNPYLADFYKDMGKVAFAMQVWLLHARFRQQQQIAWNTHGGVADRSIYEDGIFAKMLNASGHISDRDYETYRSLVRDLSNFMRRPDVIVMLDLTPQQALARIHKRNRACEASITIEYLEALHAGYEAWVSDMARQGVRVVRVNWSQYGDAAAMAPKLKALIEAPTPVMVLE